MKRSASPIASESHASELLHGCSVSPLTSTSESSHTVLRRSKRIKVESDVPRDPGDDHSTLVTVEAIEETTLQVGPTVLSKGAKRKTTVRVKKEGSASPKKQKPIQQALETPHPAPARWSEAYSTIKDMRSRIVAPVDTMGCNRAQLEETIPQNQRFATLVSLMLSSQTKDETTFAAVGKLREAVGGSLSVDAVLKADASAISEAICKVGFWRRKTQYIKQATQRLRDDFNSDVPKTVDELCSLPGVGPKMAFLCLQDAWKLNAGIGVDVHVHRITNRLGWHKPPTKTPEETRLNLQSWLPLELHPEINALLVGFGQTICLPVGPRCDSCELNKDLCPSARKGKSKSKKEKAVVAAVRGAGPKVEIALETESVGAASDASSPLSEVSE
ncbi:DNA glycosylase [Fomitopsis serialis]|uniref:DNA glycosylase n=1 Tax=Fomitopsis serialis TaxID=139415 RepID=UPI0020081503|nr:DNA glycosylase [Neoantrodia serialis]KAH9930839.1 DNA glycosylase [Neoantrodia serialis]